MVDARDYPSILDSAQVATLLRYSLDHVRKLSREGVLPAKRMPGGKDFRYFRDDVLEWFRGQSVPPPQSPRAPRPTPPPGIAVQPESGGSA